MEYRMIGHRTSILGRLFLKKINEKMLSTGLTGSQWSIINRLLCHGPLTQSEICEQLSVEASTISKTINNMEVSGWITRTPDEKDKREKKVELTDKAKEQLPVWLKMTVDLQQHALEGVSSAELEVFDRVLDQIIHNLQQTKN